MEQNLIQAKFLIKELIAMLDILPESEYDEELEELMYDLMGILKK